mgnify:CR=1 FL=1
MRSGSKVVVEQLLLLLRRRHWPGLRQSCKRTKLRSKELQQQLCFGLFYSETWKTVAAQHQISLPLLWKQFEALVEETGLNP